MSQTNRLLHYNRRKRAYRREHRNGWVGYFHKQSTAKQQRRRHALRRAKRALYRRLLRNQTQADA